MLINSVSIISGKESQMEINITPEQYTEYLLTDTPVSKMFPHLNGSEQEFLISGVTPEEWKEVMEEFVGE
jgi:hypothetical protein